MVMRNENKKKIRSLGVKTIMNGMSVMASLDEEEPGRCKEGKA